MLQIEVICFGLAIEVQRLQNLNQELNQDLDRVKQLNKTHLNTIDQYNLDIQHLSRKLDMLNITKIQIEQDYNQLKSQHDYVIDVISQITGDELTLEELTELIEELKKRSLKYDQIQEVLNGQDLNEIISKSEQFIIQYNINQELKDQLEQYPEIVICLNQDIQKQKTEIQNQKLLINQLTEQNAQLQEQILKSKLTIDQRHVQHKQSNVNLSTSQSILQEKNDQQYNELTNQLYSTQQQNQSLKEEIQSILNLKLQIEAKLRNSLLDQNKLLTEKEKLAKETFYLVSLSNNFKTQLQNQQTTISEQKNEISLLQCQNNNNQKQIEDLTKQNKDLEIDMKQEINNLNQLLQEQTFEIDQLKQQNIKSNSEVHKISEQLQNSLKINRHSKELSQQIEIIQDKLCQNKNIIQIQDNQLQLLQQQSIDDKKELQNHYIKIIEQLNEENSKLQSKLNQFQNTINQLEDQLIEFQNESQDLKDLLDNKDIEINKLIVFNKKIQQSNEKHIQQNQELEQQIRQLQFKYSSSQKISQENSRSSDYYKSQILEKIKSENQQYQQDIYKLELINQELIEQITSMKFEINKYQIQITNLTMQIESILPNEHINELQQLIEKQEQKLQEQINQILKLQNDINIYQKKFCSQEQQIDEQELFIRQLQQELNQLSYDQVKMQQKLQILEQENLNKCEENNDLKNELINLRAYQNNQSNQNEQIIPQQLEETYIQNDQLLLQNKQLNQQILELNSHLEQKSLLIDKFNLKLMNQNTIIFQLKQQIVQFENQIKQLQNTLQLSEQKFEEDQSENRKLNEITQLNIKLSKVIDEKEQKIVTLKQELQVSQKKLNEIEQLNKNIFIEKHSSLQQSEQLLKSQQSSETLFLQNIENEHQLQLQILQKKYDDILKENQLLIINSHQIEEQKNKIALLSMEVFRYHNLLKGQSLQNTRENTEIEKDVNKKIKSFSQEKGRTIKTQQGFKNNFKECDLFCLLVLLFAEIESLRSIENDKRFEDKSKVQQIIDYYRQKVQ